MRRSSIFASLFFFLVLLQNSHAENLVNSKKQNPDHYIAMAATKGLAQSRTWRILLHYKQVLSGYESLIDDPAFFLARHGKTNPSAELDATIRSFFRTDVADDQHPVCLFPARFRWLDQQLGLSSAPLPQVACPLLDKSMTKADPTSVSMIFASAHINSPASMFGHPFLRVDTRTESKLLSNAISYAARTDAYRGPLYAYYGLFGYYHGFFSFLPYYDKVSEYNDIDLRDLWEYHLDLSAEEARMMLYHLWELDRKYSYYYFFDENCAYIILFLLEAARPSLDLTSGWGSYVLPVDSFRRVLESGIVTGVSYRPSKMTKIMAMADSMGKEWIEVSWQIAEGKVAAVDAIKTLPDDNARKLVLDMAAELLQKRFAENKLGKKEYQKLFLATLASRGSMGGDPPSVRPVKTPQRPDMGHLSGAFTLGYEANDGPKGNRATFSLRPALHDIMDPQAGYVEGSQIDFLSFSFSTQPQKGKLWIERADLVGIVSLSPINSIFTPMSWKANFGLNRREFANDDVSEALFVNGGGGYTTRVGDMGLAYFFLEADLQANHNFDKGYALGPGLSLGLILDPVPEWKTGIKARATRFVLGHEDTEYEVVLSQRYTVHRNMGIHLDLKGSRIGEREIKSALLKLVLFM